MRCRLLVFKDAHSLSREVFPCHGGGVPAGREIQLSVAFARSWGVYEKSTEAREMPWDVLSAFLDSVRRGGLRFVVSQPRFPRAEDGLRQAWGRRLV